MLAYADDVALVVVGKSIEGIEYTGDQSIEIVGDWLRINGLRLAAEKTEVVLIFPHEEAAVRHLLDRRQKNKDGGHYNVPWSHT